MAGHFERLVAGLESPAEHAEEVAPSDAQDLATAARSLYVGTGGNLRVTTVGGDSVTFVGVQAGSVLPVRAARVHATGTTATDIIALW